LRAIIGIPVYNEQMNIRNLLGTLERTLMDDRVEKICIVSSSTDLTNTIVRAHSKTDERIELIVERERRGKATAWNRLIQTAESEGFDAMVYLGGDNLPCPGGISMLLDELEKGFGIVGGRPVPVDPTDTFLGWHANLLWSIHHLISKEVKSKISGEMCALRVGVVREMPPGIINDDVYLQQLFELRGFRAGYCERAKVLLRGPSTLSELMRQRKRVYIGHHQVRMYIGQKPSTVWYRNLLLLGKALPSKGLRASLYLILSLFIQGVLYLIAKLNFHMGNLPYKWRMAETTKSLRYGL